GGASQMDTPTTTPSTTEIAAAMTVMMRVSRVAMSTRDTLSWPKALVPSHASPEGGRLLSSLRGLAASAARGGAMIATAIVRAKGTSPMSRPGRSARRRVSAIGVPSAEVAGVDDREDHVDQDDEECGEDAEEQHDPADHGVVAHEDRIDHPLAQP